MILDIIHTTDLHGRRGIFDIIPNPSGDNIILDSGDAIKGSCTLFNFREPILSEMKNIGFSAMAMGNREYSYFKNIVRMRAAEASFPILAANVIFENPIDGIVPFINIERHGFKIAVIGLAPIQFYGKGTEPLSFFAGSRFIGYSEALNKIKKDISGADFRILLSHSGLKEDIETAEECPFIDLILAGHSHLKFKEPVYACGIPIIHSGAFGLSYAEIRIDSDSKKIVSFRHVFPEAQD